ESNNSQKSRTVQEKLDRALSAGGGKKETQAVEAHDPQRDHGAIGKVEGAKPESLHAQQQAFEGHETIAAEHPNKPGGYTKGQDFVSGATPVREGQTHVPAEKVKAYADAIGAELPGTHMDGVKTGGFPGRWHAVHVETQMMTEHPDAPVHGVSKPMC